MSCENEKRWSSIYMRLVIAQVVGWANVMFPTYFDQEKGFVVVVWCLFCRCFITERSVEELC
jgi:hypothetical protein